MAAPTQIGTEVKVGLGSYSFDGYIVESSDREPIADVDEVRDENDACVGKIISNPGYRITQRMMVKATSGTADDTELDSRKIGDTITLNTEGHMIESWKVSRSNKKTYVDFTAVKEESMEYT